MRGHGANPFFSSQLAHCFGFQGTQCGPPRYRTLTTNQGLHRVTNVMRMRLTSLVLVLLISGGLSSGMPLHSNEQECSMPGMAGMDCCKKAAQTESLTPEVSTARLCCALNCSQSGTTGSTESRLPRPSTSQAIAIYPSSAQPMVGSSHLSLFTNRAKSPPRHSNPA